MTDTFLLSLVVVAAFFVISAAMNCQCGPDESERRTLRTRLREFFCGWRVMWALRFERRHKYPMCRVIPLIEAAKVAREQTCKTRHAVRAHAVCDNDMVTQAGYFAALLGDSDTVALYGHHRGSRRFERVSRADFREAQFVDDGAGLKRYWEGTPIYTDLQIPRCDLRRRVKELVSSEVR